MKRALSLLTGLLVLIVSVPLRGSGYERIASTGQGKAIQDLLVSVPLRGSGYESPTTWQTAVNLSGLSSFRPLAGKWL